MHPYLVIRRPKTDGLSYPALKSGVSISWQPNYRPGQGSSFLDQSVYALGTGGRVREGGVSDHVFVMDEEFRTEWLSCQVVVIHFMIKKAHFLCTKKLQVQSVYPNYQREFVFEMSSRAPLINTWTRSSRHASITFSRRHVLTPMRVRHASATSLVADKTLSPSKPATLSALPTPVLLRSLLVSAISSKPYLLGPSLSVFSFLTRPNRSLLFDVDRNPVLHSVLKTLFYRQFCAGESPAETKDTMRHLRFMGFRGTILTYAKETVFDHKTGTEHGLGIDAEKDTKSGNCSNIEVWRKGALETVDLLGEGDQLALKCVPITFWILLFRTRQLTLRKQTYWRWTKSDCRFCSRRAASSANDGCS